MNIKEFAQALHLSPTTVSHALNGKRPVSAATRRLIEEKMPELGYIPNVNARRLVSSRSYLVAFSSEETESLNDPYQIEVTRSLCRNLRQRSYDLLLDLGHPAPDHFASLRQRVQSRAIDGSILIGKSMTPQDFPRIATAQCPCVYIDSRRHAPQPYTAFICVDCRPAYRQVLQCLQRIGRTQIALLARVADDPVLDNWLADLPEYGFAPLPERIAFTPETPEDARDATLKLLMQFPETDAILARTDAQAFGALAAARQLRVAVPERLSIIGHSDVLYSRIAEPPLSTISFDYDRLGQLATDALFQLIDHPERQVDPICLPGTFLPRGSVV